MFYQPQDFAYDHENPVGWGSWTEGIFAITNRATYTEADNLPSMGTDYFVRIREGESNMEWVQLVGTLTITNKVGGSNEVYRLETPDGTIPRMTLMGDHSWRYHYEVPTNAIGGTLSFKLVTKEYYTNETDAATWLIRTNELFTVEKTVTEIPYTATLDPGNPNEISVILDESSTHLKIEYNDEQRAFALSHASYQTFNLWTDARLGFRGNSMETNGEAVVSNSGVSGDKQRYNAPFDSGWELCPQKNDDYFTERFLWEGYGDIGKWFSAKNIHGWDAKNSTLVRGTRGDSVGNYALTLDGNGKGSVCTAYDKSQLPIGIDSVKFTARVAQPPRFDDFAYYEDGMSCKNYAISAKVTMSRMKETDTVKPSDMSPANPSVSFVGYHRGDGKNGGCYEFRMTRMTDTALELALYKWIPSGSDMTNSLLTSTTYTSNLLVPTSTTEQDNKYRTAAYFLVYTLADGKVKLEGHLASSHTALGAGVTGAETGIRTSAITYVDDKPGRLSRGGSYGVGSTDCRADFGAIRIHTVETPPTATADAVIMTGASDELEGFAKLDEEWIYYTTRWEVDPVSYDSSGGISSVLPSNQVVQVYLADGNDDEADYIWSGYEVVVSSFSTNRYTVSPHMPGKPALMEQPGIWRVRLQTGEEDPTDVVIDDIEITPWEGVETWIGDGSGRDAANIGQEKSDSTFKWVYTKGWITATADIKREGVSYRLPEKNMISVETDDFSGYAYVFDQPGTYEIKPQADLEIERALVVGGGGAGGAVMGGGGGGGGVLEHFWTNDPVVVTAGTTLRLTVGAGGTAPTPATGSNSATTQPRGNNGGNSSLTVLGTTYTAVGGGGGDGWSGGGARTGGSGGGGSHSRNGAAGTAGQGFAGGRSGNGSNDGNHGTGGGGGGAGGVGQDATLSPNTAGDTGKGGDGGPGKASDITGEVVSYGGGGGGGAGWVSTQTPGDGKGGGGRGSDYRAKNAVAGTDGLGGGGGGGTWYGSNGPNNIGARGGCGTVILRVRAKSRVCTLQPSRGREGYPMGLRTPFIDKGMSLFSYSYKNVDSNCVMLVQISTNMTPTEAGKVLPLTESIATSGDEQVWTTIATHRFKNLKPDELASGTRTTFISLRQHWIWDNDVRKEVYTNVCGVVRVIVDPSIVSTAVSKFERTPSFGAMAKDTAAHDALVDYGKITITKAYCYNEPALDQRSWFGFNVHTEGWDGNTNVAGPFAYLTDWPDGLSIALNFSALPDDNRHADALGIGLAETDSTEVEKYKEQNPFIQCAALTNGIGTVNFRARLFDTNSPPRCTPAVVTLYGSKDPAQDQPTTESQFWKPITNFVVESSTYHAFEWKFQGSTSPYRAVRLEAAGARHGRNAAGAKPWEWGDLLNGYGTSVTNPINRVFIDEMSVSELIVPRLKFLDVRPFRNHLGSEDICVISNILSEAEQPLIQESWGIQCRVEPQQMADELDKDSIRVWMEVYRGETPWGYKNWVSNKVDNVTRFSSELQRVSESNLVFRSYYTFPDSIMKPEETPNTVYQYAVRATYRDKSGSVTEYPAELTAADWVKPEWYRGSSVGAGNDSGDPDQFSAYTILDSISPYRAWINELNLCDAMDVKGLSQFIELAVPQGANLKGWYINFTDYNKQTATLVTIGVDQGVMGITSKTGGNPGMMDSTNYYTFVSVCAPTATGDVRKKSDGYWPSLTANNVNKGVFQYLYPYGIQLMRPSGIIEHEIVMQGTNTYAGVWGVGFEGTNLVAELRADKDNPGTWFYAGEDLADANTSLGVFRSHGEYADPSNWTNWMYCTPGELNKLKDGTLQEIPKGYFLQPYGGNVWIYSTLLKPQYMKQFLGSRELKASDVIVIPAGESTNIVFSVTNWYQIASCTTNETPVSGAQGSTRTFTLNLNCVSNTVDVMVDAEPQTTLTETWGLTPDNRYTPAVLAWLLKNYGGYGPDDLSAAEVHTLSLDKVCPLTLTEMYWLNIPPVHADPDEPGGSNIWFVASMGAPDSAHLQAIEPHVTTLPNGTIQSNVYVTVTMMITNTVTGVAEPPKLMNGVAYNDGEGSQNYSGNPAWTSVVFSVTGALQKPDVANKYLPLQQYVFTPDSFGDPSNPNRRFQTRIEVVDPFARNSMGSYYGWSKYRDVYSIWYRWSIKDNPDGRGSIAPLKPNWTPPTP